MYDKNDNASLKSEEQNLSTKPIVYDNPDIEVYEHAVKACENVSLVIWNKDRTKVLDEIAYIQDLFVMYRYIVASFGFDVFIEIVDVQERAVSQFKNATTIDHNKSDCAV